MDTIQRKEAIIIGIATIYSLLFFAALTWVYHGQTQTPALLLLVALLGVLWIALMTIFMSLIVHKQPHAWALPILPPVMALLSSRFSGGAIIGSLFLFLALLGARRSIRHEIKNRLKFTTVGIFRPSVRLLLLGVAAFSLALTLPLIKSQAQSGQINLPVDTATTFIQPLTPLISQSIPNYQTTMTIDQIIQNQLNQQSLPAGFVLPPDAVQRSRQDIERRLKLNLSGQETIPAIVSRVINQQIQNLAQGDGVIVTLILLLFALITIRALIPLLVWPILFSIIGLMVIAHKTHFVKKVPTPVTVERYQL